VESGARVKSPAMALALGLGAAAALALVFAPDRAPEIQRVTLDAATLRAWVGPDDVIEPTADGARIRQPDDPKCSLLVLPVAAAGATDVSALNATVRPDASTGVACDRWQGEVTGRVRAADRQPASIRPGDDVPPMGDLDRLTLALAAALIGALLVLTGLGLMRLPTAARRQAMWIFVIAASLRLLFPDRLAMVYFGYELLGHAAHLDALPRYGPGSTALWSMLLGSLTDDHGVVLRLHDLLGAATVAIWAMVATRISGQRATGWWVGAVLAFSPLFLRDHGSESVHVGAMWAVSLACYAAVGRGAVSAGGLAVITAGCVLAGLFRADVAPLTLFTVLGFRWLAGGRLRDLVAPPRTARLLIVVCGVAGMVAIALLLGERVARDLERANLPQLTSYPADLPRRLLLDNVLLRAELFPLAAWAVVLAWIARGRAVAGAHHRWLLLPALAIIWLLPYYADFNETSMLRLQVPAATLFAMGAAALACQLATDHERPLAATLTWAILWLLSAGWTLPATLQTSNAHAEDRLLAEALDSLPGDEPFWLVTRSYADGATRDLHLHLPTWRFHPPWRNGRVVSIRDWQNAQEVGLPPEVAVYYLQGYRCWMHRHDRRSPSRLHDACLDLRSRNDATPVFRREAPNLGDSVTFDLYGASDTLEVGLWLLTQSTRAPGSSAGASL